MVQRGAALRACCVCTGRAPMLELKLMHGGLRSGAYDQGEREEEWRFSPRSNARSTWTETDEEAGEETLIAANGFAEEKTIMA